MVGKVYIKWGGGYHPSMGKTAKDPTLEKKPKRRKEKPTAQQPAAAPSAEPGVEE